MMLEDAWKNWLAGAAAVLCGVLIWFAGPLFRISGADLRQAGLCGGTDRATSVTGHLHGDTVLLEVSRPAVQDAEIWKSIVRHLYGPSWRALLGLERIGPRAVVACFGIRSSTGSAATPENGRGHLPADPLLNEAQYVRDRLDYLSGHAASQTQVYVLYTGLENIP